MRFNPGIRFHPRAKQDLINILKYLNQKAPTGTAQLFFSELETTLSSLLEQPEMGVRRSYRTALLQNTRMIPLKKFEKYLLFYLADDGHINVIRLIHGSRDIAALFNKQGL